MSDNDLDSQRVTERLNDCSCLNLTRARTRRLRRQGRVPIGVTSAVGARDRRRPAGFHTGTPTAAQHADTPTHADTSTYNIHLEIHVSTRGSGHRRAAGSAPM